MQGSTCKAVHARQYMQGKAVNTRQYTHGSTRTAVLARQYMRGSKRMAVHARQYMRGSSCEAVHARLYMQGSTCKAAHVRRQYIHTRHLPRPCGCSSCGRRPGTAPAAFRAARPSAPRPPPADLRVPCASRLGVARRQQQRHVTARRHTCGRAALQ